MILGGVNDSTSALRDIAAALRRIEPDEIHLSWPSRPPAEPWVEVPTREGMDRAASILGEVAEVLPPTHRKVVANIEGDLVDAIWSIVARHPLKESEIEGLLTCWLRGRVEETLRALPTSGKIKIVERFGERFWCAAGASFPDPPAERRPPFGPKTLSVGGRNHGGPNGQVAGPGAG
jgi:hypothetical protein